MKKYVAEALGTFALVFAGTKAKVEAWCAEVCPAVSA